MNYKSLIFTGLVILGLTKGVDYFSNPKNKSDLEHYIVKNSDNLSLIYQKYAPHSSLKGLKKNYQKYAPHTSLKVLKKTNKENLNKFLNQKNNLLVNEYGVGFNPEMLKKGDIIAHTSKSSQSQIIKTLTNSPYTHIGIINIENGKYTVIEASSIVREINLKEWVDSGMENKFSIFRLEDIDENAIIFEAKKHLNKKYDLEFNPSDEKMYCSELVQKVFENVEHKELGKLEKLQDYLNVAKKNPQFKITLDHRFPNDTYNYNIVTPKSICDNTKMIFSNY